MEKMRLVVERPIIDRNFRSGSCGDTANQQTAFRIPVSLGALRAFLGRRLSLGWCFFPGLFLLAVNGLASAEVTCPDVLSVEQRAAAPSGEWQVSYLDRPARLIGVTVFDGLPPDRKVRPSTQRSSGGTLTIRWLLRENRRSYYVMCSYEHTAARLYAALPPGVLLCEAAFDLNVAAVGGHPVKRMFCQ
jgi:hypothetical protein